jgi:putative nucleotidyltransferase with HDIG domain
MFPKYQRREHNREVSSEAKPKITVKSMTMDAVLKWETTPYNLYIKLPDGRFLIVLRSGNPIDKDRLGKYAAKGVTTLFASDQDLSEINASEIAPAENAKIEALEKLGDAVFDELRQLGVSEASFNHAKAIGKAVRNMLEREPKLSAAFAKFQDLGREDTRHSLMVSALSTVLVSSMDWVKPATHENVAMGALLHDFGRFMLPPEILNADPATLSVLDRKILEGHAESGRALLAQVKTVPEDVIMIVAQHHERSDGSGYPLGLKDFYIHPLARVVGLANELVEKYEADRKAGRLTSIRILIEGLIGSQASKFNRDLIKSLRSMLDSDVLAK